MHTRRADKLKVGVVIESTAVRAWEYALLERIASSPYAELAACAVSARPRHAGTGDHAHTRFQGAVGAPVRLAYRALEAKIECDNDAFVMRDAACLLRDVPKVPVDDVREVGLDVWIELSGHAPRELAASARHGLWVVRHAPFDHADPDNCGFWPVYNEWPITESLLIAIRNGSSVVLARARTGTNRFSAKLNRSKVLWTASSLIARKLRELHADGADACFSRAAPTDVDPRTGLQGAAPTVAQLAGYIGRNLRRRASDFMYRHFHLDRWTLLVHAGPEPAMSLRQFRTILPPADRFWADPFVLRKGDHFYVFVEEFEYRKQIGHIAVIVFDETGRQLGPSATVLERPYHLSYPCVFEHGGDTFMIPESSANRTVELYRCVEFPHRWHCVETLLRNISAVDATALYHNGQWWLFAAVAEQEGASLCEELFVFHSDALVDGRWKAHQRNPVISDVRKARPAGAIFEHSGKLYRPAQDCSVRYGYAIRLHEVTRLHEDEYSESHVASITPQQASGFLAMHSFAYTPGLTVLDGLRPRFKGLT